MIDNVQSIILLLESIGMMLVDKKLVYFYYLVILFTLILFIFL